MQFDNYDLSTIHYALFYYMDNANLDEDEMEWLGLLREKVDSIMVSQINAQLFCVFGLGSKLLTLKVTKFCSCSQKHTEITG